MNNTHRIIALIGGVLFGLAIPIAGVSGSAIVMSVYWTVILFLFGAYMLQGIRDALTKKE